MAGPAPPFRHADAEEAEAPELLQHVERGVAAPVPVGGVRHDLATDEVAGEIASSPAPASAAWLSHPQLPGRPCASANKNSFQSAGVVFSVPTLATNFANLVMPTGATSKVTPGSFKSSTSSSAVCFLDLREIDLDRLPRLGLDHGGSLGQRRHHRLDGLRVGVVELGVGEHDGVVHRSAEHVHGVQDAMHVGVFERHVLVGRQRRSGR